MNQEQNNLNQNNLNTQGNNGIPNNQPLNNQNINNNIYQNQTQPTLNYQQPINQMNIQPTIIQPINNTFERENTSNQNLNGKPPKKKNLGLIIGIVIVIVLIISSLSIIMISNLSNNSNNSTIQDNNNQQETKPVLTFEEKLKKLEESNASDEDIQKLFFENIEITTTKVNENDYLISLTNKTPYDLYKFKISWKPVKDGKVSYIGTNNPTVFNYIYSGETVYAMHNFNIFDTKTGTIIPVDTDEIKLVSKSYKSYHEAEEGIYKNIIVTNARYDKNKGVIYTIKNPYDTQKYPTVNILYYKDDKVIYVEKKTQYYLKANTTLTDYEFSKSSLTEKYELVNFDFDYIKVVIDNSKE